MLTTEGPALLLVTAAIGVCLYDGFLDRMESLFMLVALSLLRWATRYRKRQAPRAQETELEQETPGLTTRTAVLWFSVGPGIMLAGAEALVWGASQPGLTCIRLILLAPRARACPN